MEVGVTTLVMPRARGRGVRIYRDVRRATEHHERAACIAAPWKPWRRRVPQAEQLGNFLRAMQRLERLGSHVCFGAASTWAADTAASAASGVSGAPAASGASGASHAEKDEMLQCVKCQVLFAPDFPSHKYCKQCFNSVVKIGARGLSTKKNERKRRISFDD